MKFEVQGTTFEIRSAALNQTVVSGDRIDFYKNKMKRGEEIPVISAYYAKHTTDFFIGEGHHRVNAAWELYNESGDSSHLLSLFVRAKAANSLEPPPAWLGRGKELPTRTTSS